MEPDDFADISEPLPIPLARRLSRLPGRKRTAPDVDLRPSQRHRMDHGEFCVLCNFHKSDNKDADRIVKDVIAKIHDIYDSKTDVRPKSVVFKEMALLFNTAVINRFDKIGGPEGLKLKKTMPPPLTPEQCEVHFMARWTAQEGMEHNLMLVADVIHALSKDLITEGPDGNEATDMEVGREIAKNALVYARLVEMMRQKQNKK